MTPAEFEPAIPASERPQTHALDRAATGLGGRTTISVLIYICWGVTEVIHANKQTDDLCSRSLCTERRKVSEDTDSVHNGLSDSRKPCAVLPLTACSQPAIQAKLQASATYLSDACAGTEHVAGPLAAHWLMFRSRVDQRHWSSLVVAPKCSMIKREETVTWLNLFIACNKAVWSASKSIHLIVGS
jgi:hypothetical protein